MEVAGLFDIHLLLFYEDKNSPIICPSNGVASHFKFEYVGWLRSAQKFKTVFEVPSKFLTLDLMETSDTFPPERFAIIKRGLPKNERNESFRITLDRQAYA